MDPERWRRIDQLYHLALEQEPSEQNRFLAQDCEEDLELRADVESLLSQSGTTERVVDRTARYFGGLSVDETSSVLKISPETAKRDWKMAKAWLLRELGGGKSST